MNPFIQALIPVIVLIVLGIGLKRTQFLNPRAWAGMEKLTYYFLFPALLIHSLGNQSLSGSDWKTILAIVIATVFLSASILIFWNAWIKPTEGSTFTSIFQGGVRFNTYIALSIALSLYGQAGLDLSSIAAGFMIVVINILCIGVFALYGPLQIKGIKPLFREIFANPLIIACVIGWVLSLSGLGLPILLNNSLEILGRAALPLGLLAVGASLNLNALFGQTHAIITSSITQFLVKPVTVIILVNYFELDGLVASILLIMFMVPTAPSGYILARQLGGDTETMGSIITFQTLLAFFVMPLIAWIAID